jgi:fibronectin-binding autotransporter adhesin
MSFKIPPKTMYKKVFPRSVCSLSVLTGAIFALLIQPSTAQSTWDGNFSIETPGSGVWSDPLNWNPDGVPLSVNTTQLFFGGSGETGYTSTIDTGDVLVGSTTYFEAGLLTLNSSSSATNVINAAEGFGLNLKSPGSGQGARLTQNGSGAFEISAPFSLNGGTGSTALNFDGTGTGAVTFSGNTRFENALKITFSGAYATNFSGATLTTSHFTADVTGAGLVTVSSAISALSGNVDLIKSGSGTLLLTNTNNAFGQTGATGRDLQVLSGTVLVGNNVSAATGNSVVGRSERVRVGNSSGSTDAALLTTESVTAFNRIVEIRAGSSGTATVGGKNTSGTTTFAGPVNMFKGVQLTAALGGTVNFSGLINDAAGTFAVTKVGAGTVELSRPGGNTYDGGTIVNGGELIAKGDGVLGTGNVTLNNGFELTLTNGTANNYIDDLASLLIFGDTATTKVNLDFLGTDTISGLAFNGAGQSAGTWGATGSGAQFESDYFTGTGILTVIPEPSSLVMMLAGFGMLVSVQRFRRVW